MWYSAVGFLVTFTLSLLTAPLASISTVPPGTNGRERQSRQIAGR